jgi:hypothetical protein
MVGFLQKMPETSPAQYKELTKGAPADHMEPIGDKSPAGKHMGGMGGMAPMK